MSRFHLVQRFGFAALLVVTVGSVPVVAADEISAVYDVSVGGARVMKAEYAASVSSSAYNASLEVKTTGMSKLFSKLKLNMAANGKFADANVRPSSYNYSKKKNGKRRERALRFMPSGDLVTDGEGYDQSILTSLSNTALDPLSMFLKLGRQGKPCAGKHRAFDGRDVFDLTLSKSGGEGGKLVCKMVYLPVAGDDVDDGNTDPTTYAITLAPMGGDLGYVPVKLSGSSSGVSFEAAATAVSVNGTALSF
jgi:hypothetical protein